MVTLWIFCYGDEENGHRACTNEHLTTANQSEIREKYLVSVTILDIYLINGVEKNLKQIYDK